jgi:hypothetical protein
LVIDSPIVPAAAGATLSNVVHAMWRIEHKLIHGQSHHFRIFSDGFADTAQPGGGLSDTDEPCPPLLYPRVQLKTSF